MTTINIGTSSWNYDDWRGLFYPEKLSKKRYLAHYATHFNTVEVNTSFYALPRPATLINWVEAIPPGFTLSLKCPRAITHEKRLGGCEADTRAYLDAIRSLGEAAAPGFIQLPPDFTRQRYGRALAAYLDWLAVEKQDLRLAVEVRSQDLMTSAFAAYLAERGFALVLVEREGTPDLFSFWNEIVTQGAAPEFAFVRWIGDDKNGPTGNREVVNPQDDLLSTWANRLAGLVAKGVEVYGYMHNPFEGHSPASVRRLYEKLEGRVDENALPLKDWPPEGWSMPGDEEASSGQLSLFGE